MASIDLTSYSPTGRMAAMVDELIACYVDWREDAADSRAAYACWCESAPPDRRLRFASYLAALDQEESAAAKYAEVTIEVARRLEISATV